MQSITRRFLMLMVVFFSAWLPGTILADVLYKLPDLVGAGLWLKTMGTEEFLGTDDGIFRIDQNHVPMKVADGAAEFVKNVDGTLWFGTLGGFWRLSQDQLPEAVMDGYAKFVKSIDGTIWLGTSRSLWRLNQDAIPVKVLDGERIFVEPFGGTLLVGTVNSIWRVDADQMPVKMLDGKAKFFKVIANSAWLATDKGLWRLDHDKAAVKVLDGKTYFVKSVGGITWLGSRSGLWRLDQDNTPVKVLDVASYFLTSVGGSTWLGTSRGLWRLDQHNVPILVWNESVEFIEILNGTLWLGTDDGFFCISQDHAPVKVTDGWAKFAKIVAGATWLGTSNGLWRIKNDNSLVKVADGEANFVKSVAGTVWIGTGDGTFHHWGASTTFDLSPSHDLTQSIVHLFMPQAITDGELEVRPTLTGPEADRVPVALFDYIVETDHTEYLQRLNQKRFSDTGRLTLKYDPLSAEQTIYIAIRDPAGRITETTFTRTVVPAAKTLGLFGSILYIAFIVLVMILAPYSAWCHSVVMNRYVRSYGSLGLIPVILTLLPLARHHLLKRYRNQLAKSSTLVAANARYVPPETALESATLLDLCLREKRVFVEAASGMGKTMMVQALVAFALKNPLRLPLHALPVLVTVGQYPDKTATEMIVAELKNHGHITDTEFAKWLVDHGNFLLVFDGLNEVSQATRDSIASFIEEHWQQNLIIVTSQFQFPAFQTFPYKIVLHPLSPAGINAILQEHLQVQPAVLSPAQYKLYSRPQNLLLAIERMTQNRALSLPDTVSELYGGLFEEQFAQWRDQGQGDYPHLLCERAYTMLKHGSQMDASEWEEGIEQFLLNNRIAFVADNKLRFAHDLLRAYLASRYFAGRWRTLLATDGGLLNENWISLLEFATHEIIALSSDATSELRELIFTLVSLHEKIAVVYMTWCQDTHPDRCSIWSNEFYLRIGQKHLDDIRKAQSITELAAI